MTTLIEEIQKDASYRRPRSSKKTPRWMIALTIFLALVASVLHYFVLPGFVQTAEIDSLDSNEEYCANLHFFANETDPVLKVICEAYQN